MTENYSFAETEIDLESLKFYLRIDGNEEDKFLKSLVKSAEQYLLTSCGIKVDYNVSLYTLAIQMLVNHWYENRTIAVGTVTKSLEYGLNSLLMQLRYGGITYDIYDID